MGECDNRKPNGQMPVTDGSVLIRELLDYLWRLRVWIVLAVAVSLIAAFCYLRLSTPVYERTTWMKLNGNENSINAELALPGVADASGNKRMDNEVFILRSPSLMRQVVEQLNLNTRYYQYKVPVGKGKSAFLRKLFAFKKAEFYGNNPFTLRYLPDPNYPEALLPTSVSVDFKHVADSTFRVDELLVDGEKLKLDKTQYAYGDTIRLDGSRLTLSLDLPREMVAGGRYIASWTTPYAAARGLVERLAVSVQGSKSNRTDVVIASFTDSSPTRAADILNTLVNVSNMDTRKYKEQNTLNVIDFIDGRLREISDQLRDAESGYKDYQSARALVNSDSQTDLTIVSDMSYRDQLTDVRLQLQILNMITAYMDETPQGLYRAVPSNLGITGSTLVEAIKDYNDKIVDRNRMVANSSENNPKVLSVNTELEVSRKNIELSLANLVRVYSLREQELEKVLNRNRSQIAAIPQQQLELQQLSRKLEVIEPLYQLLQQKREENMITMYGEEDSFRVIEPAFGASAPVSPNKRMTYLLALFLGFAICPCIERARAYARSKVETKADVEGVVDAPVLAVLPSSGTKGYSLIPRGGHDPLCESLRMLRTTVQSLEGASVIQVTSSVLGEGKSFVAANLALALAYVGKKVVLVGMDLRKPALPQIFHFEVPDPQCSLVGYLYGRKTSVDEIIVPSGVSHHLDLLPAGQIPQDPNELLAQGKHEALLAELRGRYDYVILDSTPYFPVADSSIINKSVDATLFVVRCDYTSLKLLREIDAAARSKVNPIRNLCIVLNDFNRNARKYRYGYGVGYGSGCGAGYGYGYGYGYGFDKEGSRTKSQDI